MKKIRMILDLRILWAFWSFNLLGSSIFVYVELDSRIVERWTLPVLLTERDLKKCRLDPRAEIEAYSPNVYAEIGIIAYYKQTSTGRYELRPFQKEDRILEAARLLRRHGCVMEYETIFFNILIVVQTVLTGSIWMTTILHASALVFKILVTLTCTVFLSALSITWFILVQFVAQDFL